MNDHHRLLAREVIDKAHTLYVAGEVDDLPQGREAVLNMRWPVRGSGGVAQANLRTQRAVSEAIREFYTPPDHCPEPSGQ